MNHRQEQYIKECKYPFIAKYIGDNDCGYLTLALFYGENVGVLLRCDYDPASVTGKINNKYKMSDWEPLLGIKDNVKDYLFMASFQDQTWIKKYIINECGN